MLLLDSVRRLRIFISVTHNCIHSLFIKASIAALSLGLVLRLLPLGLWVNHRNELQNHFLAQKSLRSFLERWCWGKWFRSLANVNLSKQAQPRRVISCTTVKIQSLLLQVSGDLNDKQMPKINTHNLPGSRELQWPIMWRSQCSRVADDQLC